MDVRIDIKQLCFSYPSKPVIRDLSVGLKVGTFYGILGPNGCGKTTLIDLISGHRIPDSGSVRLNGKPLAAYSRRARARQMAVVPQEVRINFPFTCRQVVTMGRYPFLPRFGRPGRQDVRQVDSVLKLTDLAAFTNQPVTQLSGGERQRVVFARALAQNAPVMLLDEATANLDIRHAIALLNLAAERVAGGATVVAVMQDVNLAALFCDELLFMRDGRLVAAGSTDQVLTPGILAQVLEIDSHVYQDRYAQRPQVVFKR